MTAITALDLKSKDFNLFSLITLHPSWPTNTPTVPTYLLTCTLRRLITGVISPLFTSDPLDTRITSLILALPPVTNLEPKMLSPQLRG